MGYDTYYTITAAGWDGKPVSLDDTAVHALVAIVNDSDDYGSMYFELFRGKDGPVWGYSGTGYQYKDLFAKALKVTPAIDAVTVHGSGDEEGDIWDATFTKVDGRVHFKLYRYEFTRSETPAEQEVL